MKLSSGIDLIEIGRFERLKPAILQRFMERVFTPSEMDSIHGSLASAAGRFAAKEAVAKALGCGIGVVRWQDIEVGEGDCGQPLLHLHGRALEIAQEKGFTSWSISISHTAQYATAIAIAHGA